MAKFKSVTRHSQDRSIFHRVKVYGIAEQACLGDTVRCPGQQDESTAGEEAQGDNGAKQMYLSLEEPATACDRDVPEAGEASHSLCQKQAKKGERRGQHPDAGGMGTSGVPWK